MWLLNHSGGDSLRNNAIAGLVLLSRLAIERFVVEFDQLSQLIVDKLLYSQGFDFLEATKSP
jgi:hypothetical protein